MSDSSMFALTCMCVRSCAMTNNAGAWMLAATIWPTSTLREITMPSIGDVVTAPPPELRVVSWCRPLRIHWTEGEWRSHGQGVKNPWRYRRAAAGALKKTYDEIDGSRRRAQAHGA